MAGILVFGQSGCGVILKRPLAIQKHNLLKILCTEILLSKDVPKFTILLEKMLFCYTFGQKKIPQKFTIFPKAMKFNMQ